MILRERRWIRIDRTGGAWHVAPAVEDVVLTGRRIVLIVHGYNNDPAEATASYAALYNELASIVPATFFEHIWEVYWPGYWPTKPHKIEPFSALSYPMHVRNAPQVGKALAEYLERLAHRHGGALEILFIAHSLGCRVVLEAMELLASTSAVAVPGMCLMAAAVPTTLVEQTGALRPAASYSTRNYILFSPADTVLRWFFRPGQLLAAAIREWPEAVGRFGNPRALWDLRFENVLNTGLNHGEYYSGRPGKAPLTPNRTAPILGRMFGRALPMYLRQNDPYVVDWELPSAPPPRSHRPAERVIY